ncbi:hypothetical protein IWQ61_005693 [Dispira simplex]|nr:hypothetical protein IWQ61_005693 [Dispira simplex]
MPSADSTVHPPHFPSQTGSSVECPTKETARMVISYDQATGRKMVNQYLLLQDIGRGCHGRVKQALDVTTGKMYAIKIIDKWQGARRLSTRWSQQQSSAPGESLPQQIPPEMARLQSSQGSTGSSFRQHVGVTSPVLHAIPPPRRLSARHSNGQLDKIRKEIAILKKCRHPNVVHLYEVVDDPAARKIYLILDYLEGGEIRWRDEDDLPLLSLDEIRSIFRDLVLGVEYLHYQGIIHRDIKPANLLRDSHGVVKISDFGVSHFYQQAPPYRSHLSRPESTYSVRSYVPSLPSYTSITSSSSFQPLSHGRPILTTRHRSLYSPSLLSSHSRDSSFQFPRNRTSLHDLGPLVDSAQALGRREPISRPLSVTLEYYPPHPMRSDVLARQHSDSPLVNKESHFTPTPHRFPSRGSIRPTSLIIPRSLPSTHARMVTTSSSHFNPHSPATNAPDGLNSDLPQARALWSTSRAKSPTSTKLSPSKSKHMKTPVLTFSSDDEDEIKGNLPDPPSPLTEAISVPRPKGPVCHPSGRGLPPPSLLSEAPPPGEMAPIDPEEPMVMPAVNVSVIPTDAVYNDLDDSDSDDFWSDFDENEAELEDCGLGITPTYVPEPVVSNPPSTSPGLLLSGVDQRNTTPAKTSKSPHSPTVVKWAGVSHTDVHPFSGVSSEPQGSPVDQSAERKSLDGSCAVPQYNPGSPSRIQWPTVLPPLPDPDALPSVTEETNQKGSPSTDHVPLSYQRAHHITAGMVHRTSHATLNEDKELAKTAGSPAFFAPELCCTTQELTSLLREWAETRSLVNPPSLGNRHVNDPSGVPTSTNRPLPLRLRRPSLSNLILSRLRRPLVSRSSSTPVPAPPEQSSKSTSVSPSVSHSKSHSAAKSSTTERLQSEVTDLSRKYSLDSTALPQTATVRRQFSLNRNLLHPSITLSTSQQLTHRCDTDPLRNKSDPITETSVQPTYAPPFTRSSDKAKQLTDPFAAQSHKPRSRSLHVNIDQVSSPAGDQTLGSVRWKWWQALSPSAKAQVTTSSDQGSQSNSVRSDHHILRPDGFDKRHRGRSRSRSCLPEFRPVNDAFTFSENTHQRASLHLQRGSDSTSAYPSQVAETCPTSQLTPSDISRSNTDTSGVPSSPMPGPISAGPSLPQPTQAFLDYPNLPTPSYYGITKAIDLWAMGVTLYCLVYGRCPFVADTEYELFQNIPRQPLTFPDDIRTIPVSLRDLLTRLLDKDYRTRITIEEVKRHPWVTEGLQTKTTSDHWSPKSFTERPFPDGQVNGQDINHTMVPSYQWPRRIGQGLRRLSVSIAKGLKGWRIKSKDHIPTHR